jgi:hypothetical protein
MYQFIINAKAKIATRPEGAALRPLLPKSQAASGLALWGFIFLFFVFYIFLFFIFLFSCFL